MSTEPSTSITPTPTLLEISNRLGRWATAGVKVRATRRGTLAVRNAHLLEPSEVAWLKAHRDLVLAVLSTPTTVVEIGTPTAGVKPESFSRLVIRESPTSPWVYDGCRCVVDPSRPDECRHRGPRRPNRRSGRRVGAAAVFDLGGRPRCAVGLEVLVGRRKLARRFGLPRPAGR